MKKKTFSNSIQEDLKKLPDLPGVYIMRNSSDQIIYVGKAISLRNRVRQYFRPSHDEGIRKDKLVENIDHFEYIICDSELEALILECNLIKEHRPKYNTLLRDDKTYPYIKVTVQEDYPRLIFTRRVLKDKAKYFGPFTSAKAVKDTIIFLEKAYCIRTCNKAVAYGVKNERACLNYHIHQCDGVCQGNVDPEIYRKKIDKVISFLNGNSKDTEDMLRSKMLEASEQLDFEKAAEYRDLLESLGACVQKQKASNSIERDTDIVAIASEKDAAVVVILFVREGKLLGRDHFLFENEIEAGDSEIVSDFIKQFYDSAVDIPKEIYLPIELEDSQLLEEFLSAKGNGKVSFVLPKIGKKEKLVELAYKNAKMILDDDLEKLRRQKMRTSGALEKIGDMLGLSNIHRLEAYDISNTSGFESVGSMVVFLDGKPMKQDYRKFRLRTVEGPNDYASMKEVLTRRFVHGLNEQEDEELEISTSFSRFPDVIMMDGGLGQVHIAEEVLEELSLDIPVCGMVKDDHHNTRGLIYKGQEIPIDKTSDEFHLITRLQDEAHRFAITYHKNLRADAMVHSVLDDIPGIGPARRKALMGHFQSLEDIKNASLEELESVEGISHSQAIAIRDFFD